MADDAEANTLFTEGRALEKQEKFRRAAGRYMDARLMADSAGVVILHFTLPEGLTTWKFMALAHTKDMFTGVFSDEVVAQKDVMAQLNLPRFVRKGDRATLSATLAALCAQRRPGDALGHTLQPDGSTVVRHSDDGSVRPRHGGGPLAGIPEDDGRRGCRHGGFVCL